jgi:hypothetical protein
MAISRFSTSSVAQGLPKYQKVWDGSTVILSPGFDSIATYALGSNGTVTFTSIPQTYKHLQLRIFGKTTRATFRNDNVALRFNGDTGNNYSSHEIIGDNGTGTEANTTASYSMIYYGGNIGSTVMASTSMGVAIIDIFDYTNTNKNTTTRSISGWDEPGGGGLVGYKSGQWMNTAAVTEIFLRGGEGTQLGTGTRVALYGIKG